jgi:lipopolysaccharide export system protein LptA
MKFTASFYLPYWMAGIMLFVFVGLSAQKGTKITLHSENNQVIDATSEPIIQYLNGDVKLFHTGTFMYCDTAILRGNELKMRHNVVLMQNDSIKIFCDSLHYSGDSLVAYLYGKIILENGPSKKLYTTFLRYDVDNKIAYYTRNAKLIDGNSTLISRSGRYMLNEKLAYFYKNVKITGDKFELVTDSISYNTENQVSSFLAPVKIVNDSAEIYSERGWFDLDDKKGDFIGNAQYLSGKQSAFSDTISYTDISEQVRLSAINGKSIYYSEKDTANARVIFYDKKNEKFILQGDSWYKSSENEVKGEDIVYDKKTEKFNVKGRSFVSDPPFIIEGEQLAYDKSIKYGKADGYVIWKDTSAKTTIKADHVLYKGEENFMKAHNDTGRPLFISEIDKDSLFMKADTMWGMRKIVERIIIKDKNAQRRSQKNKEKVKPELLAIDSSRIMDDQLISDTLDVDTVASSPKDSLYRAIKGDTIYTGIMDTLDYFIGQKNVRIYKSDLQVVCDSVVYNKRDSIFTFHRQPFIWKDSTQIAGDTIDVFLSNKKISKLVVTSGATLLNTEDMYFFNQIKGRIFTVHFVESKINRLDVDGDAQLVYYLKDDNKAYIGVNTTEAAFMTFLFNDDKISDIRNYREPKSKVLPMKKTDHNSLKVKGFNWNIAKRPKGKDDL